MSTPQQVFPAPAPAPAPAGGGGGGRALAGVNQQQLMWIGAGLVVVVALVQAARGERPAADDETPTVDTSRTDFYNELQPELEAIQRAINDLGERPTTVPTPTIPSPTGPRPVTPSPKPPPAASQPKPPTSGTKVETYLIRSGDTLSGLAKRFKVSGGWKALYRRNQAVIEARAKAAGRKNSGGGHWIYPGTRIDVKW